MAAGFPHNSGCTCTLHARRLCQPPTPLLPPLFFSFCMRVVCRTAARNTQRLGEQRMSSYTPRNDSPHELFQKAAGMLCGSARPEFNLPSVPCELSRSPVHRGFPKTLWPAIVRRNLAKRTQKAFGGKVEGDQANKAG